MGILGGGELGGEGVRKGDTGKELPRNNGGFREKANGLESVDASLCAEVATVTRGGVVKLGVGKSPVVLGLRQGTASRERGVTRISPSNPRLGGENSAGTLPKFKKRETSEKGLLGNRGGENGVSTEGDGRLTGSAVEAYPSEAFPFLKITSGSATGVDRGSCGWDRVCLPLEATTKTAGSLQWSRHNGVARCTVAIFKGSDA
jgi:hypothetical protein